MPHSKAITKFKKWWDHYFRDQFQAKYFEVDS